MVSWSIRTVSTTRHISISCCQSRLLRAKRETSRAQTAPTLPRHTFRDYSLEAGALDAACGRPAEIVVDHLDLGPAECRQAIPHGVLQRAALAVVQNLMGRRLPDIEQRLALQMMGTNLVRDHDRPPSRSGPAPVGMLQDQPRHQTGQRCPCLGRKFRPCWRIHYCPGAIVAEQVELLGWAGQIAHPLHPAFRSSDRHRPLFDSGRERPVIRPKAARSMKPTYASTHAAEDPATPTRPPH